MQRFAVQLGQAGAIGAQEFLVAACVACVVGVPLALYVYFKVRSSRVAEALARKNYDDNERRNQAAFDHNLESARINDQKQRLEIRMLELQIQLAESELAARREHGDVGDLMTEKARLEIESLRLHIRDQRKGGLPDYDD